LTTTVTELTDVLLRLLRPLHRIGVPTERLALLISLSVRSVPVIAALAAEVRDAQRARGLQASPGPSRCRCWCVLRQAQTLGEALLAAARRLSGTLPQQPPQIDSWSPQLSGDLCRDDRSQHPLTNDGDWSVESSATSATVLGDRDRVGHLQVVDLEHRDPSAVLSTLGIRARLRRAAAAAIRASISPACATTPSTRTAV
jgi:hypothetical protein